MFLLSAIKKAVGIIFINENSLLAKKDTNVMEFAIKQNKLVLRHVTFGSGQRLKLELTSINQDFSHIDTDFYSVSLKVFSGLINGCVLLGGGLNKSITIDFNLDDKIGTPTIKIGEHNLVIPCECSKNFTNLKKIKDIGDYDSYFNKDCHLFKTNLPFEANAIKTAAKKDVRYYLMGVALNFISLTDDCYLVDLAATDGHRLNVFKKIIHKKDVVVTDGFSIGNEPLIIGSNGFSVLTKLINNSQSVYFGIHSAINGAYITVFESEIDGIKISLVVQTLDAKYPNYNNVAKLKSKNIYEVIVDVSQLESMINYMAIYLIGNRAEKYKIAVFNIDTNDGYIHLSCIPNHFDLVTKDTSEKTKENDDSYNEQLSIIDENMFSKISNAALKHRLTCESMRKTGSYKIGFNINYFKDVIEVFKKNRDKSVCMQFCFESIRDKDNSIGSSVLFKNYADDIPVNDTGNILSVLMPVRL